MEPHISKRYAASAIRRLRLVWFLLLCGRRPADLTKNAVRSVTNERPLPVQRRTFRAVKNRRLRSVRGECGCGYSSMVEISPGSCPSSFAFNTRRMIFPERVLGSDGTMSISEGTAIFPSSAFT